MNGKPRGKTISNWVRVVTLVLVLPVTTNFISAQSPQHPDDAANRRNEEVGKLIAVLRDADVRKDHPEKVVSAIQRLGEMRAVEAVDDLIELLTFARRFDWESKDDKIIIEIQPITEGNRYPATSALFQIGRPALPALVKVVESNSLDSVRGQNAVSAIRNIFRDDLSGGVKYLEHAAEESANVDSGQRLTQAATQLRQLAVQLANPAK